MVVSRLMDSAADPHNDGASEGAEHLGATFTEKARRGEGEKAIRLTLEDDEIRELWALASQLAEHYGSAEVVEFHLAAAVDAHDLPRRVREVLTDFRQREPRCGLFIISRLPLDDAKIGPTPWHWKAEMEASRCVVETMVLVLLGNLLGDCIGWSTQQEGRIVHDILPIKGNEQEQLGTGSEQPLSWHTEDAFHPLRGDYLGMLCLRNPDRVPTTFASLQGIELDPDQRKLLFEPHYTIRPDESHLRKNRLGGNRTDTAKEDSYQRIEQMQERPERIPVFYGDPEYPYVRIDPYFMDPVEDHPEAQRALEALMSQIDEMLCDLVLEPGEFCFIDNLQAVHGRRPFKAHYDGTDRWLKRIIITRDLRKSRVERGTPTSRVIR